MFLDQFAPTNKASTPPPSQLAAYKAANTQATLSSMAAEQAAPQPTPQTAPEASNGPAGGFLGGGSGPSIAEILVLGGFAVVVVAVIVLGSRGEL